jgi:hypothetical protein
MQNDLATFSSGAVSWSCEENKQSNLPRAVCFSRGPSIETSDGIVSPSEKPIAASIGID